MLRWEHKKRRLLFVPIVLFLSVSMLITGCGDSDEPEVTQTPAADTTEHERALEVEDGTMSPDSTVIAVGKTPVTYREYLTYYHFMEEQYGYLLGDQVWKQRGDGDKTIGQEAIEDVLRMIIQVKVIVKQSEHMGITLEADEKEDADYNAQKVYDAMDAEEQNKSSVTAAQIMKIFEENRLAKKVYNVVIGQVESGLNEADSQAYRVQLLFKKAGDDREKTRAEMEKLKEEIASSDKNFYYYAKRDSDLDEVEYIVGALDERKNLWNAIISQNPGSIGAVVEESDGFYIVNVLERPGTTINTEYQNEVISQRQTEAFQEQYETWSGCYEVDVSDSLLSD